MLDGFTPEETTRLVFGMYARHAPCWMYVQNQGEGGVSFVGASRSQALRFDGEKEHQFVLGEIIVRPHFVVESNAFIGYGLGGLATAHHEDFITAEDRKVLLDPFGKFKKYGL
ncbi:MAG TPA: hypothetical protein V6C65_00870 [Allocoleopsis sp.]